MVVSNGSLTKRFEELVTLPKDLLKHLFIKFSFHYMELKRLNMMDKFVSNVNLMKENGVSYTIEITPSDELEPYIDEIKDFSIKTFGALPHITVGRKDTADIPPLTKRDFEEYKKIWGQFDSDLFKFKSEIFGTKRKEFCYAGEWSAYLNIETGDLRQCYCSHIVDNIYKNIDKPIRFCPVGNNCKEAHCYNGHAFLTFGDIPELDTPTYDKMRDRECVDGSHWLNDEMREFMSGKLVDSNKTYSEKEKKVINAKNKLIIAKSVAIKAKNKIKRKIEDSENKKNRKFN
jgi:hypothetical protein